MTPMIYIAKAMEKLPGGRKLYMQEWREMSDKDKSDLRKWAREEMEHLGIKVG